MHTFLPPVLLLHTQNRLPGNAHGTCARALRCAVRVLWVRASCPTCRSGTQVWMDMMGSPLSSPLPPRLPAAHYRCVVYVLPLPLLPYPYLVSCALRARFGVFACILPIPGYTTLYTPRLTHTPHMPATTTTTPPACLHHHHTTYLPPTYLVFEKGHWHGIKSINNNT